MSEQLLQALDDAIEMENEIRGYYLDAMAQVKSDFAKDALSFLADQELMHIQNIKDFIKSMEEGSAQFDLAALETKSTRAKAKEFFQQRQKYIEENTAGYPDDAKIYEVGLDIEREGYKFYAIQADSTEDEMARKFFEFLKDEETLHYDLLDRLRLYLVMPGIWFIEEEAWMFDGA